MKTTFLPTSFLLCLFTLMFMTSCKENNPKDVVEDISESAEKMAEAVPQYPNNQVFWGNTHLHTALSSDGFGGGTRLTTEDALRIAIGEEVTSNTGQQVQIARPHDFIVITDHAEGFGWFAELAEGNPILLDDPKAQEWYDLMQKNDQVSNQKLAVDIPFSLANDLLPTTATDPKIVGPLIMKSWQNANSIVERYNNPGTFTTLHGYEWTSVTNGNNLHRNVVFRDGPDKVDSILPFSALQSDDPEKLWEFLARYEEKTGGKALAIPHNGNVSGGEMFGPRKNGEAYDRAYVEARARWEPLYEVMQIKGAGETHPSLSPNDEFASFGINGWDNGNLTLDILSTPEQLQTQYARKALIDGLKYEKELGTNPFKFGLVSASDAHTAITNMDEDNWWGKLTTSEPSPERLAEITKVNNGETRYGYHYLSSGYSAVWAKSNTREAIWDAMKRKETFATTGTRIKLRFFGSLDYSAVPLDKDYLEAAYANGVPMGGDLSGSGTPTFIVHAVKDPNWANLDRVQIVKGWLDANGKAHERIYEVAWSDERTLRPDGKLPAVGNTVDIKNGTYTNTIGAPELKARWEDPDFDPALPAMYYARVLEIPSPTWQLYDILKYDIKDIPKEAPLTQQERAWSSPIWYTPN